MLDVNKLVPIKYNGDQLDSKMLFVIDFLILNLKGIPKVKDSNVLKYTPHEYGSKAFKHILDVDFRGRKFGMLYVTPRSPVMPFDNVQFKLDNALFYTMSYFDIKNYLKSFLNELEIEFTGVSRLDLAVDYMDESKTQEMAKSVFSGDVSIKGRKKHVDYKTQTDNGRNTITGMYIGKRSSSRMLRIYDKTLEMEQVKVKTYIQEAWDSLNMGGRIWRYEYQLSNKFMRDVKNLDLDSLFNVKFLMGVFEMAQRNHFELKENTGKSEVNKEFDVSFLDVSLIREVVGVPFLFVEKIKRTIAESLIGVKRLVKGLFRSYVSTGQQVCFIQSIKRIIKDYDLMFWWSQKMGFYLQEFKQLSILKHFDFKKYSTHFSK